MNEHIRKAILDHGCRMAWLRQSARMTPSQLGKRAGLDTAVVEQIERGELSASLEQLRMIAGALGVKLSHVFDSGMSGDDGPESFDHALIVGNVVRVLGNLVGDTSFRVLPPGVALQVPHPAGLSWPDVVVVRDTPVKSEPSWLIREPVVIVEVMTDTSEQADRGEKFVEYRKLDSLVDYVMVQTRAVGIDHYSRDENQKATWRLLPSSAGARVQLQSIPGVFAVDDLYRGATIGEG